MQPTEPISLWQRLSASGPLAQRSLRGATHSVGLAALADGTSLAAPLDDLRGASVLLLTREQLPTALALIELDGIARRLVICPLDVRPEHLPAIVETAEIDIVVGDRDIGAGRFVACRAEVAARHRPRRGGERTEWVLTTSGTTGTPKLVVHTLCTLSSAMAGPDPLGAGAVWSTFYDMRRYGGLQIFLRALLGGGSMVLSSAAEPVGDFLVRAGADGVTHISGTPSHWRRALMSPQAGLIAPRYVRLSGEIADQAILDNLRAAFPQADVAHAFASTEAGVGFSVGDGLAGFPAGYIGRTGNVELRVAGGSLRIKSSGNALGYLGGVSFPRDESGFVDTGDMVERHDGRYHFVGRRGGIINIGGQKVHPEEIEAVLNGHPAVRMSRVTARRNPITGAVVVADVVTASDAPPDALKNAILDHCRGALPRHKVPATIRLVPALDLGAAGKLARHA